MSKPLRVVMTAGATREPIDDVRHLSNVASGALPAAMAETFLSHGAHVHYVHGPGAQLPARLHIEVALAGNATLEKAELDALLSGFTQRVFDARLAWQRGTLTLHPIGSAAQAAAKVSEVVSAQQPDLVVCAMAVADFAPTFQKGKLSSTQAGDGRLKLELQPTPKVIDTVLKACPTAALLGFKLLSGATEAEHREASAALARRSGARWVFSNDMADYRRGRRRGVLWRPNGDVLARLEGGEGDQGRRRLGAQIASAVLGYLTDPG